MKKICSIALAALLALGSVAALASCSAFVDDENVLDDYMADVLTYPTEGGGTLVFEDTLGGTAKVIGYTGKALENDVVEIPSKIVDGDEDELLVTGIGKEAFYGLSAISEIRIPATVTYIDEYAFAGCTGLVSVSIVPGSADAEEETTGDAAAVAAAEEVTAEETVAGNEEAATGEVSSDKEEETVRVTIGNYAFQGCVSLVSIDWMDGLTDIGDYAFYGCRALAELNFPETLETIGQAAFWDCRSLTTLDTNKVKTIGIFAFYNCLSLDTIYLRDDLTTLGAFDGKDNDKDTLTGESVFVIKLEEEELETSDIDPDQDALAVLAGKIQWGDWEYNSNSVARQYYEVRILSGIVVDDDDDVEEDVEEDTGSEETTTELEVEEPIWN